MSHEAKNHRYVASMSQYGRYNQSGTRPRPSLLLVASQASLTLPRNLIRVVDDETNPEERFPSTSVIPENALPPLSLPSSRRSPREYLKTSSWIPDAHRRMHSRGCDAYVGSRSTCGLTMLVCPLLFLSFIYF